MNQQLDLSYPPDLPVSARREEIMAAIVAHQVVIVSGQTGSGKTTQLPKMCLELGRGQGALIGHTQPRRLAARSVATRIAQELGTQLGDLVGFQVRFTSEASPNSRIKLMTDGILLAEIARDPLLRAYDTLIIDEAHERSLNIDFILGYLARLCPQRPDLKVIITSATIDAERFAAHFSQALGGAKVPVISVSGRTFPVEIRYRPLQPNLGSTPTLPAPALSPSAQLDAGEESGADLPTDAADWGAAGDVGELTTAGQAGLEGDDSGDDYGPKMYVRRDHLSEIGYTDGEEAIDQVAGICGAVDELLAQEAGDILIFLAGERDIRDTTQALASHLRGRYVAAGGSSKVPGAVEVLPLYSRLSAAEQARIFAPHSLRRIILATNVAETSLTVPGIRYVIDTGLARISRFSNKTKVQRLPIEAISQASAGQRAGRCGRVAPGICIRLYAEEDFASRPEYTEPEILRTSLAAVILQMISLGLGQVEDFPFIDPPAARVVRDGIAQLVEIGALRPLEAGEASAKEAPAKGAPGGRWRKKPSGKPAPQQVAGQWQLTGLGRKIAKLPIDPRLARILLAAERLGCASEVLVIVAALAMQDVRERPVEHQQAADEAHARFATETSDFIAYLNLWRYLRRQQAALSGSAFRRLCQREFLHYLRVREWQDLVSQLRELAKPLGLRVHRLDHAEDASVDEDSIHRALLTGMLGGLGNYDELKGDYAGARGAHFVIWPGSGLAKKRTDWVMAAELVETSRLFARTVAKIDPGWIEKTASHLVTRQYYEPYWSMRNGAAMVHEKVSLYGLTVVADKVRTLASLGEQIIDGQVATELARQMFIANALVEGQWNATHRFIAENEKRLATAREAERRRREIGLVATPGALEDFFNQRIPREVTSQKAFDAWWKHTRASRPDLLNLPLDLLLPEGYSGRAYPDTWRQGDLVLPLSYTFTPAENASLLPAPSSQTGPGPAASAAPTAPNSAHSAGKTAKHTANKGGGKGRREIDVIDLPEGVSLTVPLEVLPRLSPAGFDWGVPGDLQENILATIRALPKAVRKLLVPAPALAAQIHAELAAYLEAEPAQRPSFQQAFSQVVAQVRGVEISAEDWAQMRASLPEHRRMHFVVISRRGQVLGLGDDLEALQVRLGQQAQAALQATFENKQTALQAAFAANGKAASGNASKSGLAPDSPVGQVPAGSGEKPAGKGAPNRRQPGMAGGGSAGSGATWTSLTQLTSWPELPFPDSEMPAQLVTSGQGGNTVQAYPALRRAAGAPAAPSGPGAAKNPKAGALSGLLPTVEVGVFSDADQAARSHRQALAALLAAALELPVNRIVTRWSGGDALILAASPYPSTPHLVAAAQVAAGAQMLAQYCQEQRLAARNIRSALAFSALRDWARDGFEDCVWGVMRDMVALLRAQSELEHALQGANAPVLADLVAEVREWMQQLVGGDVLGRTPAQWRPHLARYLRAGAVRVEKARGDLAADDRLAAQVDDMEDRLEEARQRAAALPFDSQRAANLEQAAWMIEELRVSLFAQQLGTSLKVSPARISKLLA